MNEFSSSTASRQEQTLSPGAEECLSRKTVHDLKNIFSILLGNIDLQLACCRDHEQRVCLDRMLVTCNRGIDLLDKIPRCRPSAAMTENRHVLLASSDPELCRKMEKVCAETGIDLWKCGTIREAFARFLEKPDQVVLAVIDEQMAGNDRLREEFLSIRRNLRCLVLSETAVEEDKKEESCRLLFRQEDSGKLLAVVREMIDEIQA